MSDRTSRPFTMTINMAVLESLGINLYSNAAAVLAELVANAYDADATLVQIEWKRDDSTVIITDDGSGMTREELDSRFLMTGYQKRKVEGTHSEKWNRAFMGRKGIGKLSAFSIAEGVTIYSTKNNISTGCAIIVNDLKESIGKGELYHPKEVDIPIEYMRQGTTLVLNRLKSERVGLTAAALRKRLARRFDVLDRRPREEGGFKIEIDGEKLTFEDRQELKRLEFIWEFGKRTLPDDALPTPITRFVLEDNIVDATEEWLVSGWIGTARSPSDLTDDTEAGSLKNIIVLARKRPIHDGILDKLDFSRVFGNYVTGQIEADFLDLDDRDDIATSDRQRLIEDDPRVIALQKFLRRAFYVASEQWIEARPTRKTVDAFEQFPQLENWRDDLPPWQQKAANKMIESIAVLPMEKRNERTNRAALYRSGVLAFARIGLRESAEKLDQLSEIDTKQLLHFLGELGEYEASLWTDILRARIEGIRKLEQQVDKNVYEKEVRDFLFDNLWLLDPAWERATGSPTMEEDLRNIAPGILAIDRDEAEIKGRMDIRYRTITGSHIIVELKRPDRSLSLNDLLEQGNKYFSALKSVLRKQDKLNEGIQVFFILGDEPRIKNEHNFADDTEYINNQLLPIGGRIMKYEALIANARSQYADYLSASQKASKLEQLLASLDET